MSGVAHTIALCALMGTGCATAARSSHDTADRYRELRRVEAELERGLARAERSQGAEREAHVQAACDASEQACALADELQEPDAESRCEAARHRCLQARQAAPAPEAAP